MRIQIFGTDLSESVIEHARLGIYSSAIEKDVSPARLKRFFVKRDGTYQIHHHVREICTFARQNITADRKSTRLNSSHLVISYAVFCLKKKKTSTALM